MKSTQGNKGNTIKKGVRYTTPKKKKRVLELLSKRMGIIKTACVEAGVSTKTYYEWIKKDKKFAEKTQDIQVDQRTYVESVLMRKITEKDTASVIFYLKCRHPDYKTKSEHEIHDSREMEEMRKGYSDLIKKIAQEGNDKDEITKDSS
jgi:hypothetical protein